MAHLLLLAQDRKGEELRLDKDVLLIGRNPECGLVISANAVSREHAQIQRINGRFFLKDLKSRNKTYLNNQELNPEVLYPLTDQDRLKICDFSCQFVESPVDDRRTPPPGGTEDDEPGHSSTVMSTVEAGHSSHLILQSQPQQILRELLKIANVFARTLELDLLLPQIMDHLFQIFRQADRGFIIVRDEASGRLIPKAIKTRREKDETTARFSKTIVNRCIDNAVAILSEDASGDKQFELSQSISDFRIRSVMCTPLCPTDGKVLGVIQLDTQDRSKKFNDDDLQVLVAVSNQAAIAMDNARLHEERVERDRSKREMMFAREVQLGFLPEKLPLVPGYEFFAHYSPARDVSGDFYCFVPLEKQHRLVMAVGDVAGKGVPAALLMARLSAQVPYCVLAEADPARSVTLLNELLQQAGLADRFVTFVLASLDYVNHKLTLVNAGHLAPIIRRAGSKELEEVADGDFAGLPLGVVDRYEYRAYEVQLNPGDVVMLYTDGITDALNPLEKQYTIERVRGAAKAAPHTPTSMGKHLLQSVEQYSQGHPQYDDITLLCLGLGGL